MAGKIDTDKYSPQTVAVLKSSYIANECYSDEYRETQPEKGIDHFNNALRMLPWGDPRRDSLWDFFKTWVMTTPNNPLYAGASELDPLLNATFDILWENHEHPYFATTEDLDKYLSDGYDPVKYIKVVRIDKALADKLAEEFPVYAEDLINKYWSPDDERHELPDKVVSTTVYLMAVVHDRVYFVHTLANVESVTDPSIAYVEYTLWDDAMS